jgi:hypothetical protein
MMVKVTISQSPVEEALVAAVTRQIVETGVFIHEQKVFVQLGRPEAGATPRSGLSIQGRPST